MSTHGKHPTTERIDYLTQLTIIQLVETTRHKTG